MNYHPLQIAEILSKKCTPVSEEQLACFEEIKPEGRRRFSIWLTRQLNKDLFRRHRVHARIVPLADRPLAVFRPDDELCDMASLAWELHKRWEVRPKMVSVYTRGPKCFKIFSSNAHADIRNLGSLSHDLLLSELFFKFLREAPARAAEWSPDWEREGDLRHGEKLPDVILRSEGTAVEMCGAYSKERLLALQMFVCKRLKLNLELHGPAPRDKGGAT
ncbi:MAG TPA: hypothetical protein VE988_20605 [Gemmataceae bacterium]|nr:hypothetical protein [Gemmataceae bacterium]